TCASRSPPPPRRCHHHPKGTGAASGAAAWDPSPGRVGLCRLALRPSAQDARNSTFQTYKKEVCLPGHSIHAAPWAILQDPICCECQTRFGGCLPVPRAEAALPYWVPLSLRPRKQSQKIVQFYIHQTTKMCPCPFHCFGGYVPKPTDQVVMPYWVPQVLRSQQQVVRRQESLKGIQAPPLDACFWHNCLQICGDGCLLPWLLQAPYQDELLASPAHLLPLGLLTLLQAIPRVIVAI
uniref:Chromosome 16 open reading frame 95 n=1 Tax=Callithrix jacchus TaxID=9483 RepID=A0A8I3WDD7_CALJA